MVITDGEPDTNHYEPVKDLICRCERSGVEVIGMGIQCPKVRDVFPEALVINELDQLKDQLFEQARRLFVAA